MQKRCEMHRGRAPGQQTLRLYRY